MSTPAEIILGDDGITSVSVDSADGQSIVVTPVGGTVVSVGSAETQSIAIYSDSVEVTVQSSESPSVSISTDSITVEVATNTNAGQWPKRLRDLEDVVGDPSSGQVLIYNEGENNFQFADQTGGGGEGGGDSDELTDYAITVTNTDGAFSTIKGYTYEAFTNMTDVLNDILNPYTKTSVSIYSIVGTINETPLSTNSSEDFEVGSAITLSYISYVVGDANKVKDGSLSLLRDGAVHQGLPEISTFDVPIDPIINSQYNSLAQDTYKITFVDNGNPNGQEYNGTSNSISLNWKYRVGVSAHPTIPTDNSSATTIYNYLQDSSLENDPGLNALSFTCTEENASGSNYTFLIWPSGYGVLNSVLQNNSTDVTADFQLVGEYTVTNVNDVNVSYYIYRTNDKGAFNDDIVLTVTLKDA